MSLLINQRASRLYDEHDDDKIAATSTSLHTHHTTTTMLNTATAAPRMISSTLRGANALPTSRLLIPTASSPFASSSRLFSTTPRLPSSHPKADASQSYIRGTVNDPTTFPPPNPAHGHQHWLFERGLSVALLPLTALAVAKHGSSGILDAVLGLSLVMHSHIGARMKKKSKVRRLNGNTDKSSRTFTLPEQDSTAACRIISTRGSFVSIQRTSGDNTHMIRIAHSHLLDSLAHTQQLLERLLLGPSAHSPLLPSSDCMVSIRSEHASHRSESSC